MKGWRLFAKGSRADVLIISCNSFAEFGSGTAMGVSALSSTNLKQHEDLSLRAYLLAPSRLLRIAIWLALPCSQLQAAEPAPFDLPGPGLHVTVQRDGVTLPIDAVPALATDDLLTIEADLPEDQGTRFLLLSAFLRGATNPPPTDWIRTAETWKRKNKDKRLSLKVPKGAKQLVLFFVPATGGASDAISDTVRGRPGEFVRATQALNQASLDRSRLNAFMVAIQAQGNTHPEYLRKLAPTLARSLSMKLNEGCLDRVIARQASCLLENRDSLVLADMHSSSIADTLAGAPTDLALQLSTTREAGYGYYTPYIGVVRDVARIFGAFSNPQFNYLPTLSMRRDNNISLLLNSAPSFQKPKSVLVAAMPAIEADRPPQLRSLQEGPICASREEVVLPVDGSPLIYSTSYARKMAIKVTSATGKSFDLPVEARADRGGYVLKNVGPVPADLVGAARAALHGFWGFEQFQGPEFALQFSGGESWRPAVDTPLTPGSDNVLTLKGAAPACVASISVSQGQSKPQALTWEVRGDKMLSINVPVANADAGDLVLQIKEHGVAEPVKVPLPIAQPATSPVPEIPSPAK